MQVVSPEHKEILFAAYLLARPELLPAVNINPVKLKNETVRAVIKVLSVEGPAFAAPGPMIAALRELPDNSDFDTLQEIFVSQPNPEDVELSTLVNLKTEIERAAVDRAFIDDIRRQIAYIERGDNPEDVATRLTQAIERYTMAKIDRDHTTSGILSRLKQTPPKVRWKSGIEDIDRAFPGIGPDSQPSYGMLAQKEVTILAAQYKAGKTREMLNWVYRLLDQGASISMLVLEDDEGSFALKLMAAKFRVPKHILERYIYGGVGFFGDDSKELKTRCEAAIAWFEQVQNRLRIYDTSARHDIFKFEQALELLTIDKALYGTTHVFIDYVQAWGGEYKEMASYAFGLRAFAAKQDVSVIEISQFANETIKFGSGYGQLAAKGAGEWGQTCHIGLELMINPEVGDREFAIVLKVARDAPKLTVYVQYDVSTGTALRYLGTPEYFPIQGDKPQLKKNTTRR